MKERRVVDQDGNLSIQQWADTDYPADFTNEDDLGNQLDQALDNLRSYRDNPSPSTLQTVVIVKLLCRVTIALVRLYRRNLDATN